MILNLFFLICIIFIWFYFSIIAHEFGHLIAARIVGFNPYFVIIGVGKKLLSYKLFDTIVEFRTIPAGGITYISNLAQSWIRPKLILMYLGGPLANLFLFLILSSICNVYTKHGNLAYLNNIGIVYYLANIEFIIFICNLIPIESSGYGRKLASDGKQVINTLFNSKFKTIQKLMGLDRYTSKQDKFTNTIFNNSIETLHQLFKADALLNQQKFDDAIEILETILDSASCSTREKVYILDLLTSIIINYGETKYLRKADKWSLQALKIAGDIKTVQGTRGAILIELGRYNEGKEILLPLT